MPNFLPIGQKRLTNVVVVRMKKGGKRFEIACYPNKVLNYRNGIEKDLDEVLQSRQIFLNVSKGDVAKRDDLIAAFGTDDEDTLSALILEQGELQVSDKERHLQFDSLFHEIATIVAEKCIDSETGRPLTVSLIERAMHDAHYAVVTTRNAKQQALDVIRLLEQSDVRIARAQMRVRVRTQCESADEVSRLLESLEGLKIEREVTSDAGFEVICLVNPGSFRSLTHPLKTAARMAVEVIDARVTGAVDVDGASSLAGASRDEREANAAQRVALPAAERRPLVDVKAGASGSAKQFVCKACPDADLPTAQAHREHFKSDWHKYNLGLKTKGLPPVSQQEHVERAAELAMDAGGDCCDFYK
jgi:ribosome maturation protein SDO1